MYLTYFFSVRIHVSCINLFLSFFFLGSSIFTLQKIVHINALLPIINLIPILPSPQWIHQIPVFHLLQFFSKVPFYLIPGKRDFQSDLMRRPRKSLFGKWLWSLPLHFIGGGLLAGTFGGDFFFVCTGCDIPEGPLSHFQSCLAFVCVIDLINQ